MYCGENPKIDKLFTGKYCKIRQSVLRKSQNLTVSGREKIVKFVNDHMKKNPGNYYYNTKYYKILQLVAGEKNLKMH